MREHGVAAKTKRKFRCTTDSNHDRPVAENLDLLREMRRHKDWVSSMLLWKKTSIGTINQRRGVIHFQLRLDPIGCFDQLCSQLEKCT
jgi:hypothetical protein